MFSAENSCARTDAVFTPYPGFKSHVKGKKINICHKCQRDIFQQLYSMNRNHFEKVIGLVIEMLLICNFWFN